MGAERKSQTYMIKESVPSSLNLVSSSASVRNLAKSHLGGVIFGCESSTIKECLSKQLFGQLFTFIRILTSLPFHFSVCAFNHHLLIVLDL